MFTVADIIKRINTKAIEKVIKELEVINYDTVSELVPKLLLEKKLKLNCNAYKPKDPQKEDVYSVARYLVYNHPDKNNPFSIWIYAFAPKQKTLIHDHLYRSTVTVLDEPVTEKYYQTTENNLAQMIKRQDRYRFHTNRDELMKSETFVHQLKRRKSFGEGTSFTLHIYEMDAYLNQNNSEKSFNRNRDLIYFKDKTDQTQQKPPYEEAHPELNGVNYPS